MEKGNQFSEKIKSLVWKKTKGVCYYCGLKLKRSKTHRIDMFTVDHFISKKLGGTDDIKNLFPACFMCNTIKKNHSLDEFRKHKQWKMLNVHPKFNERQKEFLKEHGLDIDEIIVSQKVSFYFEDNQFPCNKNSG